MSTRDSHRYSSHNPSAAHDRQRSSGLSGKADRSLPERLHAMQKAAGNQATISWLTDNAPIQRKMKKWQNPYVKNPPIAGCDDVKQVAKVIDKAVENSADEIQYWLNDWADGVADLDTIAEFYNNTPSATEFANKLYDWSNHNKKQLALIKASAGKLIELHGDAAVEGDSRVKRQFKLGPSRPDYMVDTSATYSYDGQHAHAHGLIDITSKAEASKGHISEKVFNAGKSNAIHYPHLYDVYYEGLALGDEPGGPVDMGAISEAREAYYSLKAELAEARKSSLRSSKKPPGTSNMQIESEQ